MNDMHDGTWSCPKCQTKAVVKGNSITVLIGGMRGKTWPLHSDCELARPLNEIDFTKLEKVG